MRTRLKKHLNKCIGFAFVLFAIPLFCINSYAVEYEAVDFAWMHYGSNTNWGISQDGIAEIYINEDRDVLIRTIEQDNATMYLSLYTPVNSMRNTTIDVYDMDGVLVEQIPCSDWYTIDSVDPNGIKGGNISVDFINFEFSGNTFVLNTQSANTNKAIMILSKQKLAGDAESLSRIVTAINNQTRTLSGILNQQKDLLDWGNGFTHNIVGDNDDARDELNDVISEYKSVEQTFFDDFNANQQAITSDIVGWSWGGLVNCADWVGSTLTDYYNNMGDFRQYIVYPLMLGIALFFLGRGGSIIGHLFRKPTETTVNTKSVFRRDGNTRYTTTTTSRQGGVWRK